MKTGNVKFYLVGGYVRDKLLGVKSKDMDFAVEAESYEVMKEAIKARGADIKVEKPEFATVRAVDPKFGGVDFVLCRKDGYYSDGRRPDSVMPGTLYDDLARRDFTVNALAMTEDGDIIDYFNGQQDLKKNILRTVGDPDVRLNEDSLRILRAMRFMLTKGFSADSALYNTLLFDVEVINKLQNVSIERVRDELYRMFKFDTWRALDIINQYPLVKHVLRSQFAALWLKPTLEDRQ